MCLIAVGKRKDIAKLDINDIWKFNPHGAGLVIPSKYGVRVYKGLMTQQMYKEVLNAIDNNLKIAVHFRQATHGKINKQNTHPFKVDEQTYLMHNGILHGLGKEGDSGYSDSAHLASILRRVNIRDRKSVLRAVDGKFAYIVKNTIHIMGNFSKENDVWLSNTYWKPFQQSKWGNSHTQYLGHTKWWEKDEDTINNAVTAANKIHWEEVANEKDDESLTMPIEGDFPITD